MKLLLLTILLLVRAVLWHVVRIPVFEETNNFTLVFFFFFWIIRENTKESLLVMKSFLNSVSVFIWLIFIPLKHHMSYLI